MGFYGNDATQQNDPQSSAALLMKLFGQGGGGQDAVQLRSLQDQRLGELTDQMAGDASAPDVMIPGRNGAQMVHDPVSAASILRRGIFKKGLEQDMASDPFTGDAAHAQVAAVDKQNADNAAYMDPQQTAVRNDQMRAKLAPDVLKNQGIERVAEINHQYDLQKEALHQQGARDAAAAKAPEIGPGGMPVNTKPLGATEQRAIDSLHEGASLVGRLEQVIDPNKSQPLDWLTTMGKYAAYKSGIGLDEKDQARMQLAGLLKVLGASPYVMGSRHFQFMQQAQEHLTNPAATDKSISEQLQELKTIWPELQQAIITAHRTPGAPLNFSAPGGGDQYSDPNYQPR